MTNIAGTPVPHERASLAVDAIDASQAGDWFASLERALFWTFIAVLAWTPFWFGSNTLIAWGINAVLFPGLVVVYELLLLLGQRRHPVGIRPIFFPALLFSAVVIWVVIQDATWTPPTLHNSVWTLAANALSAPVEGSISVNRDLTMQALVRLITAASVFWLALQLGRNGARANVLFSALAVMAAVYAAYGLIAFAVTPGYVLWYPNRYMAGFVTSTFFNRNNFATYGGIGLVLICGLLMRIYRHEAIADGPLRLRIAALIDTSGRIGAVYLGGAFVILVAVLLSGSRGAVISTAFGIFVLGALAVGRSRKSTIDQRDVIILVAFIIAATFLAFGDVIVGKISQQGVNDESRMAIYTITLGSIADSPVLGFGYGTFADVFPMYRDRSVDVNGVWVMAHNTYLEVFQGLGLVFGCMLIASVALLAVSCIRGATVRKIGATVPAVAGAVACLVAANSLVDFGLQIQAITLTFMAILGVGVAQSQSSRLMLED